ncbi:MAG: hypothetical protein AVDCRST_MAG83-1338 [uncultured Arthrobacter sp.]|uniref:Uncharacterized protein n=1 Tax=uncultured Arthrobacter sp. TaxID=114050 RepID=A0A6J4HWA5_9MICC|nr:MAG: hypothetical protein AVDCRST_MAG83-1338 [uncultured Arthrobacter sp.]
MEHREDTIEERSPACPPPWFTKPGRAARTRYPIWKEETP